MAIFKYPYTDLYNLNLDWIVSTLKELETFVESLLPVVHTVNGETGDVVISAKMINDARIDGIVTVPSTENPESFTEDEISEMFNNGKRILLWANNTGTYDRCYLIGPEDLIEYLPMSITSNVVTVNGLRGNVQLFGSTIPISQNSSATIESAVDTKIDKPVGIASGKFLQTDSTGKAIWGNGASSETIAETVTQWLDENVPSGTTVVIDKTLTVQNAAADSKAVGDAVSGLQNEIDFIAKIENLVDTTTLSYGFLSMANGQLIDNPNYLTTDYITIQPNTDYVIHINNPSILGGNAGKLAVFENGVFRAATPISNLGNGWYLHNVSSSAPIQVRFSSGDTTPQGIYINKGSVALSSIPNYSVKINPYVAIDYSQIDNLPDFVTAHVPNYVNPLNVISGFLNITNGQIMENDAYRTTDFIEIEPNTDYVIHINTPSALGGNAGILVEYSNQTYVTYHRGTSLGDGWYLHNIEGDVPIQVRFSSGSGNLNLLLLARGNAPIDPIPAYAGKLIDSEFNINYENINIKYEYKSQLTDRQWYIIGDSLSHGDFTSGGNPQFTNGLYAGELCVYPFYIGNRTGIVVHNLAVNGATLATIPNDSRYQWTADDNYKQVGEDAEYITIWIGVNDQGLNVPLGTIDSSDVTTFYGAYNTVLLWIINNRPYAKIGIVASYWLYRPYAEAVKAIGAKYGVPVLNFYDDPNVPVSIGSRRPDVSEEIKTLRDNQYRVSESNFHPNSEFHELESVYIEEWMKTL